MQTSWTRTYSARPKDPDAALNRTARGVASGVNHIDTADFTARTVPNRIIREALALTAKISSIVTKVAPARRGRRMHHGTRPSRREN